MNDEKWDEVARPLLPGAGAIYARFPDIIIVSASWEDFYAALRKRFEAISGKAEQQITDWEGRISGDLRYIWASCVVAVDGEVTEKGVLSFHGVGKGR